MPGMKKCIPPMEQQTEEEMLCQMQRRLRQRIPKKLLDLMNSYHVVIEDVTGAVEKRGYYPKGTPITNYEPAFIEGVLVAAWPKVYEMIKENKRAAGEFINIPDGMADELPFN